MALTPSNVFDTGTIAPHFNLIDTVSDEYKNLDQLKGQNATVIMFICNHCPFVVHVNEQLVQLANDYQSKGVSFVAISSNSVETHPQDGPEYMKKLAAQVGFPFPYLYDKDQSVAKAYDAACTPDLYIFDENLKSVYHGQLDDSRPGNGKPVTGADMRNALESLLSGGQPLSLQVPSMGCNIKWK